MNILISLIRLTYSVMDLWDLIPGRDKQLLHSVQDFLDATDPANPVDFDSFITPESIPYKGEFIEVGSTIILCSR